EQLNQLCGGCLAQSRAHTPCAVFLWDDAPDATAVLAEREVGALLELGRHELGMFNDGPVHVHHIECPVRSVRETDGSEPFVWRGQELYTVPHRLGDKRSAVWSQGLRMDEVAGGLTREG